MKKLAVILRGQLRYSHLGRECWQRIIDDHPGWDIRFFIHTWPETEVWEDGIGFRGITGDMIDVWNPTAVQVGNRREFMDAIKEYTYINYNDITFREWITKHYREHFGIEIEDSSPWLPLDNIHWSNENDPRVITHLLWFYRLYAQIFSHGQGVTLAKQWCDNNDWQPDMWWSTRSDVIWHYDDNFKILNRLLTKLKSSNKNTKDHSRTLVPLVYVKNGGSPWVQDQGFFWTSDIMNSVFPYKDGFDLVKNLMVDKKVASLIYYLNNNQIVDIHSCWSTMGNTSYMSWGDAISKNAKMIVIRDEERTRKVLDKKDIKATQRHRLLVEANDLISSPKSEFKYQSYEDIIWSDIHSKVDHNSK